MQRFKVVTGSTSRHCCFEATVVDTSKQKYVGIDDDVVYESVCECFDVYSANDIANALNAVNQ